MRSKQSVQYVAFALVASLSWNSVQAQTTKSGVDHVGTLKDGVCSAHEDAVSAAVKVDKPLPNFPLRYRGAGRFLHTEIPSFQLVARYTFDMEAGVNHEVATFIDHEVEIFNVYDMDPSDGVDPDREYFVERDQQTGELHCTLNEPPLPNVFSRNWSPRLSSSPAP